MSYELQTTVGTRISIQESAPLQHDQLSSVLEPNFDRLQGLSRLPRKFKDATVTLHRLSRTITAVSFFTRLYVGMYLRHEGRLEIAVKSPDKPRLHRLQRALWQFEVGCVLVSAWKPTDDIEAIQSGSDHCLSFLKTFLARFLPWEIQEILCTYDFLEVAASSTVEVSQFLCLGTSATLALRVIHPGDRSQASFPFSIHGRAPF